ncbi:MAG TPA: alkaline phosphatase [Solirubrobacteraceae bacterium]|nr:alkaline phosphatase [Solirubrobacteraceae bacterium]
MNRRTYAAAGAAAIAGVLAAGGLAVGAAGDDPMDDRSAALVQQVDPKKPKNVILLVGDGMGDSEVSLARNYGVGAAGRLNMDALPFRGIVTHYVLSPGPGPTYKPNYVGDSAPTATAWSTGKKTIDGRLSQGPSSAAAVPGDNAAYETYMEIAEKSGKATGNVSTAEITDATPAAPSSHISQRGCQGPADAVASCASETKPNGGLGSIAEQQVDNGFDVVLGGGRARYEQPIPAGAPGAGGTVIDYAQSKGYTYVKNNSELGTVADLDGGKKVLGLFNAGNMTKEFAPLDVTLAGSGGENFRCAEGNRLASEPSLSVMTDKAIELLEDDPDGFTLQVEGASIDKQDHAGDVCGQIGETLEFDRAVGVALEFQKAHPDTLVIVTADHSHSSQMTYANQDPEGEYATLQGKDGSPLRVHYGTAAGEGQQHTHTGATVPVFAQGPQAANVVGTLDQTELFPILLGKNPSTLPRETQVQTTTVTTPGKTVTTPAPPAPAAKPGKPRVVLAALGSVRRADLRAGVEVALVTRDATKLSFTAKLGGKTVYSNRNARAASSEAFRIRVRNAKKGTIQVTAKVTGPAGTTTARKSIRVR